MRLLGGLDPFIQLQTAVVIDLEQGESVACGVVDFEADGAVLAPFNEGDARPDCCGIGLKGESERRGINKNPSRACLAPRASVSDLLYPNLGRVDVDVGPVVRHWHGGGGGKYREETENDSGDWRSHGESF